ncbi:MAG: iron chaperone [Beutenbergiaceae bacterium]
MGTIDDYLATLDPADGATIAAIYDVARDEVPGTEQGMGYGMPALTYRGKSLLSVMRTKTHLGIYPFSPAAIEAVTQLPDGATRTKGSLGFPPEAPPSEGLIRVLVRARADQIAPPT